MNRIATIMIVSILEISFGCMRDAPPQIPDFVPPTPIAWVESTVPAPTDQSPVASAMPTPGPRRETVEIQKPVTVEKPKTVATLTPTAAPAAPSLVGTWQVVEMTQQGRSVPMPAGMQMTFTFDAGGAVTMSVSLPSAPQANKTQQGTYSLANGHITMTFEGKSKTGTCVFDGPNRVTLDLSEAKMMLSRS